jgi:hypothetical protein
MVQGGFSRFTAQFYRPVDVLSIPLIRRSRRLFGRALSMPARKAGVRRD